jgi:hypothetical protein
MFASLIPLQLYQYFIFFKLTLSSKIYTVLKFEILMAVFMKSVIFWEVMP